MARIRKDEKKFRDFHGVKNLGIKVIEDENLRMTAH